MANNGSVVRKNLHDLSKPIELRELNRQLDWMWKKILGGLTAKDFSDGGMKSIIKAVEKTVAEEITADSVETNILVAALAEMMVAKIGVAKIDYAQIVDMFSERIFTDTGIAGKFRIDGLEVTQAQIVDLIVSSFRLVSQDGKVYKVSVDANGEIVTEYVEDEADWMEGGKVPDGYSAVASSLTVGNVTSGNLYVSGAADIMKLTAKMLIADEAWIRDLASDEILANFLMANTAFVDLLRTSEIFGGQSLTMIAERASRNYRQEEMPVNGVKTGDTWVIPSLGVMYQAEDVAGLEIKFYLGSDGSLYYEANTDEKLFAVEGYDLYAEDILFETDDDGNIERIIRWKIVTDLSGIEAMQDEMYAAQLRLQEEQEKTATYIRVEPEKVTVGKPGFTSEVQITAVGMGVAVNNKIFSRFEAQRAVFGDMEIRRPSRGGLLFDSIDEEVSAFGYRV